MHQTLSLDWMFLLQFFLSLHAVDVFTDFTRNYQSETYLELFPFIEIDTEPNELIAMSTKETSNWEREKKTLAIIWYPRIDATEDGRIFVWPSDKFYFYRSKQSFDWLARTLAWPIWNNFNDMHLSNRSHLNVIREKQWPLSTVVRFVIIF